MLHVRRLRDMPEALTEWHDSPSKNKTCHKLSKCNANIASGRVAMRLKVHRPDAHRGSSAERFVARATSRAVEAQHIATRPGHRAFALKVCGGACRRFCHCAAATGAGGGNVGTLGRRCCRVIIAQTLCANGAADRRASCIDDRRVGGFAAIAARATGTRETAEKR